MGKKKIPEEGIYDARQLGAGRMFVLGFQHMFAMFGATVLVPILTGLDVSTTLLFAGLGTLLFHLITGGIVPAFLGSSFAFLGGYATIAPMIDGQPNHEMLPYACFGVACAGLVYVVLSALFKAFGAKKVMRFFPPIVTGPIIIAIGLNLSSSAINNCAQNWWIAMVAIVIIIAANIWGKGMIKIIPILLGVIGSYVIAVIADPSVRENLVQNVSSAKWFADYRSHMPAAASSSSGRTAARGIAGGFGRGRGRQGGREFTQRRRKAQSARHEIPPLRTQSARHRLHGRPRKKRAVHQRPPAGNCGRDLFFRVYRAVPRAYHPRPRSGRR